MAHESVESLLLNDEDSTRFCSDFNCFGGKNKLASLSETTLVRLPAVRAGLLPASYTKWPFALLSNPLRKAAPLWKVTVSFGQYRTAVLASVREGALFDVPSNCC